MTLIVVGLITEEDFIFAFFVAMFLSNSFLEVLSSHHAVTRPETENYQSLYRLVVFRTLKATRNNPTGP
jgi:hypothetical protein